LEVDIYPADGQVDLLGRAASAAAAELGLARNLSVAVARGYLIQGDLDRRQIERIAGELLTDRIVERTVAAPVGEAALIAPPRAGARLVHVLPKPGVMDPVAQSVVSAIADFGFRAEAVRTLKKYWIVGAAEERWGRWPPSSWPTTPSSRWSSGRCLSAGWRSARPTNSC